MNNEDIGIAPVFDREEIEKYMRTSGGKIIRRKGATFYAVSISTCHIVKSILSDSDTLMTVSSMLHGEFGIEDVCLSLLAIVDRSGIKAKITPELTPDEIEKLHHSAHSLKSVIQQLEI